MNDKEKIKIVEESFNETKELAIKNNWIIDDKCWANIETISTQTAYSAISNISKKIFNDIEKIGKTKSYGKRWYRIVLLKQPYENLQKKWGIKDELDELLVSKFRVQSSTKFWRFKEDKIIYAKDEEEAKKKALTGKSEYWGIDIIERLD